MRAFLTWFDASPVTDPILHAGLAHFRFVTIHPFDDGNGRLARAVAEMALARSDGSPQRFYSMSAQIETERRDYYDMLEKSQRGGLDVTPWLRWFIGCLARALDRAETTLATVLHKARLMEILNALPANPRQRKAVSRLLDGFEGPLYHLQIREDERLRHRYRLARHQRAHRLRRSRSRPVRQAQHRYRLVNEVMH